MSSEKYGLEGKMLYIYTGIIGKKSACKSPHVYSFWLYLGSEGESELKMSSEVVLTPKHPRRILLG